MMFIKFHLSSDLWKLQENQKYFFRSAPRWVIFLDSSGGHPYVNQTIYLLILYYIPSIFLLQV